MKSTKDAFQLTGDMEQQIACIRQQFADHMWKGLLLIAILAMPISLARSAFTGWLPVYSLHLALCLIVLTVVIFLNKIPFAFKAGLLMLLLWIVGVPGLLTFGLAAPGIWWLVLSCLAASTLYSPRVGIAFAIATATTFVATGFGFTSGRLQLPSNIDFYLTQPVAWATMFVSTSAFTLIMLIAISSFNRAVTAALALRMEEFKKAKDDADAAAKAKGDFVANMSHEIRTPMNAVLGMTHLLGNTTLNDNQRKYLEMIDHSGQALLTILNDMLDFSKIEAGRMELIPENFALDDVLNAVANVMIVASSEKDLELNIGVAQDVPPFLFGDSVRLKQILTNLLSNAIKFTHRGEVNLQITLGKQDQQQVELIFQVNDTGIGLSEEQQARLFSAFAQADSSITRRFGGTGLGLSICQRLVTMMQGEISVSSKLGEGSQFCVRLPFTRIERTGAAPAAAGKPLRVLLVDDSVKNSQFLCESMRAWQWQVWHANSAEAALQIVDKGQEFDVLLLNWHLPDINGLMLLSILRQDAPRLKQVPAILMSSALESNRIKLAQDKQEYAALLIKPIISSRLRQTIEQVLQPGVHLNYNDPAGRLEGAHFLLVEDNPLNQIVASGMLEAAGAQVTVAEHGEQALRFLSAEDASFDMILMDLQMPVMDGLTTTKKIRQEMQLDIPIIAMTASVLASEREACKTVGMNDFIAKPISANILLTTILPHLRSRKPSVVPPPLATTASRSFDLGQLVNLKENDPTYRAMLCNLVKNMVTRAPQQMEEALLAWQDGRIEDAARVMHTMRGSIGTLGAVDFAAAARALELALHALDTEDIARLFDATNHELRSTISAAESWLSQQQEANQEQNEMSPEPS
ncbi:MAG: response regulator [Burkholderiales bacterium]|nr:response regulator [Burkholderiales bacterium]